ncbi:MCE family protein [Actinomadura rupiterrae]|uniref:MCE family protein n=1 Tax=Actinomadura rupiterrae TaxID=559627 RepID=UPI0020A6072B|nr:MCE family protein [Actinomadura rupiterrae]MCP2339124.1 phospholipid/cholesterol/gamma-HCH transport system substrate-binding protein [Actinomadura rupiterrae]
MIRRGGQRRRPSENAEVVKRRLAGVVFLLVPALLVALSVAVYDKKFTTVATVTLHTASTGNGLHPYADVKLRGVPIGEVRKIHATGAGATLTLAIQPDKLHLVPADVTAQMMPTTLFGQRFVALIPPASPGPRRLRAGDVISQDRSSNAIELQQVMDKMLPLLTAVRPADLSVTLSAISQALSGRGTQIGQTMVELDAYLKKMNPTVPTLSRDITELAKVTQNYTEAVPDILQAMDDATYTSRTLVDQQAGLSTVYSSVTSASQDMYDFLKENSANIIRLSVDSKPSLQVMAKYSPEFPCMLRMLNDFIPLMDQAVGKGTKTPGLRVDVTTVQSKGWYKPGKDAPRFTAKDGPNCYPVPYKGATARTASVRRGGLGLPNSPEENELVNELVAPGLDEVPGNLPDWSSVLLGPVYRGRQVTVR